MLSQYVELGLAMKLLADSAEGVGYLLKDRISDVNEFVAAVRRVAAGGSAIDPIIVSTLLSKRRSDDPLAELTPREREVLELMAEGRSNQGIADKLVITLRAVEKYVSSIFGKLGPPLERQRLAARARRAALPALLTTRNPPPESPEPSPGVNGPPFIAAARAVRPCPQMSEAVPHPDREPVALRSMVRLARDRARAAHGTAARRPPRRRRLVPPARARHLGRSTISPAGLVSARPPRARRRRLPRGRAGAAGVVALLFGIFALVIGAASAGYETLTVGAVGRRLHRPPRAPGRARAARRSGSSTLWRSRRLDDRRRRRYTRRACSSSRRRSSPTSSSSRSASATSITHVLRQTVPAADLGAAHENVSFRTSDGLDLQGWYVPSRNGAAVIAFPGRSGPQAHTRMLARHGYGVLLFDRRGEGESDGDSNLLRLGRRQGHPRRDRVPQDRPDVDPGRIGGIGLSVGGELMLEAAAETDELAAVVSEGAGTRAFGEHGGVRRPGASADRTAAPGLTAAAPSSPARCRRPS